MTEAAAIGAGLVLVVSDDPLVVEQIASRLAEDGRRARPLADYLLARQVVEHLRPEVVVLDQILEEPEAQDLLDHLEGLGPTAPTVVLLRFAPGPVGPFRTLRVTVLGGEDWFERLPAVVGSYLD